MVHMKKIGKYQLISELGQGGMAQVYLAKHPRLNRQVAIKVIREELAKQGEFWVRFQEEAQSVAALHHSNIMQIYDFDISDEQQAYMVMEFVDGSSLRELFKQRRDDFSLEQSLRIVSDLGRALGYAHGLGIVHRDVKPANVMVAKNGRIVLADFGLAQMVSAPNPHDLGGVRGTPNYMAPEQGKGEAVDGRADIYALGIILFEMVTGELPFHGTSTAQIILRHIHTPPRDPKEINPTVPSWLAQVILKCLAKTPSERFATAEELVDRLESAWPSATAWPGWVAPRTAVGRPDETISGAHLLEQTTTGEEAGFYPDLMAKISQLQLELAQQSSVNASQALLLPPPFQAPPVLPQFVVHPESLLPFMENIKSGHGRIWGIYGLAAVGKSSAVAYMARQLKDYFPDGVLWVDLGTSTPESELVRIAAVFGQTETISKLSDLAAKADFVRQLLATKKLLLVLDQVQDSEQLQWVLPRDTSNSVIIATRNQKLLQSLGAKLLEVPPFSEAQTSLFLRQILGGERILAEVKAARQLHDLVGGLPLALSIVAGYLQESRELTLAEYNDILQDEQTRLENLTDWEDGNRNVSASFELSYRSLPPQIQEVLQGLALFEGGIFSSKAVAAVVGQPWAKVKLAIGRLSTLSLIGTHSAEQYTINPLLRLFASQKLTSHRASYTERFIRYYTAFAQQNQGMDEFAQLDAEWPNLRVALRMAGGQADKSAVVHLCLALTHQELGVMGYWGLRGLWGEARHWLAQALSLASPAFTAEIQATLYTRWGGFAARQGEFEAAVGHLRQAQKLWATVPASWEQAFTHDAMAQALLHSDRHQALVELEKASAILTAATAATAIHELGYIEIQRAEIIARMGQLDVAADLLHQALPRLPNFPTSAKGKAFSLLGVMALMRGQTDISLQYVNQALAVADILGDVPRLAILWLNKGILEQNAGHFRLAWQFFNKALALFEKMGDSHNISGTRLNLGQLHVMLGEPESAKAQFEAALKLAHSKHLLEVVALAHSNLAEWAEQVGDLAAVEEHLHHAETICTQLKLFTLRPTLARTAAQLTLRRGEPELALAQAEGALQLAIQTRDTTEQGIIWRLMGAALAHGRKVGEATEAYLRALELLTDQPYQVVLTQMALAAHYSQSGTADLQTIQQLRQQAQASLQKLRHS